MSYGLSCRLIATDLDGTLLRDDKTVSQRTRAALAAAQAAGIIVVLVTARPPRVAREIAALLATGTTVDTVNTRGTPHAHPAHELAICCNGALVYDLTHDTIAQHDPLTADDAARIVRELRLRAPGVAFACEQGLRFGCEPAWRAQSVATRADDDAHIADALTLCREPVTKLIARHPALTMDALQALAEQAAGATAHVTQSGANFIELSAPNVDKAWALARLCAAQDIEPARVIAFGDMPNDIPMLRWAGRGVAVANAHADALASADEATASNNDDGVAIVIERLLASE